MYTRTYAHAGMLLDLMSQKDSWDWICRMGQKIQVFTRSQTGCNFRFFCRVARDGPCGITTEAPPAESYPAYSHSTSLVLNIIQVYICMHVRL